MTMRSAPVTGIALLAGCLLLTGCDDPVKTVRGWFGGNKAPAAVSATAKPLDCPDLRGSFTLTAPLSPAGQFDLLTTVLGSGARPLPGKPWQTVTVDGNADGALQLTFTRPGEREVRSGDKSLPAYIQRALETDYNKPVDRQSTTITRGPHYECRNKVMIPPGDAPGARIWRDAGGDLLGSLKVRTPRVFSLWAETGAGIPYWFDDTTRTARWSEVGAAASAAAAQAPLNALARQEYEKTYGKPAAAAAAEAAAAAAAAAALPVPGSVPIPPPPVMVQAYDVNGEVRALVDRNATVENIAFDNGRYILTLRVDSGAQVARTIENLRGNAHIEDIQDHGTISGGNRASIATLSMRINTPAR